MNVKFALDMDPEMRVAMSDRPLDLPDRYTLETLDGGIPDGFIPTLGTEDSRRPRMDIGLGIWTDETHRYYPMAAIVERGNAFIDEFEGRRVLIYIEPETLTSAAVFVDARSVTWEQDEVRLDSGVVVKPGALVDPNGAVMPSDQPLQMFTRWYGFVADLSRLRGIRRAKSLSYDDGLRSRISTQVLQCDRPHR